VITGTLGTLREIALSGVMRQEIVTVKRPEIAANEMATRIWVEERINRMGDRILALAEARANEINCGLAARLFKSLPREIALAIADVNPGMRLNMPMLTEALAEICVQRSKN
jgi:hypothetical protein